MRVRFAACALARMRLGGILVALASLWPSVLEAAQFSLAPTRILLPPRALAGVIVLSNEAANEVSFEVSYQRWRMDADGQWLLEPSDDLIVHPQIVTVAGNGQAVIRVGSLRRADTEGERAYRLSIQELPSETSGTGAAITMLTRLSVPVFVQVANPRDDLQVIRATVHADRMELQLRNEGTAYSAPGDAVFDVLDANGQVLQHDTIALPYVLAGAQVRLRRPLPAGLCARAQRIALTLGEPPRRLDLPLANGDRSCAD